MKIDVEFIDQNRVVTSHRLDISLAAFIKHSSIVGMGPPQGVLPSIAKGIGAWMFYGQYFDYDNFGRLSGFKKAALNIADPTEQGDFCTLVGKTVADYAAKKLLGAKYTHSYEAAMYLAGHPIAGKRPDLYCTTNSSQFSMEAKGFSKKTVSLNEMQKHKTQASAGPLPVNFSVASVTYNVFDKIRCNFHDPIEGESEFNRVLNRNLMVMYYRRLYLSLSEFIQSERVDYSFGRYLQYDISPYLFGSLGSEKVSILLDVRNLEWQREGDFRGLEVGREEGQRFYIDVDGVGVKVG